MFSASFLKSNKLQIPLYNDVEKEAIVIEK